MARVNRNRGGIDSEMEIDMAKRSSTWWYRWFCGWEFADIGSLLPAACPEGCGFAVLC
jgi:hypothetical protein